MIVFCNNTDHECPITFRSKREFLKFANWYISHPSRWGNRYAQDIDGLDIQWSARANRGAGGWVQAK